MRETTVINDQPSAGGSLLTTHVSACPHPFAGRRIDYVVPAGLSIAEIVELIQPDPVLRAHGVAFICIGLDMIGQSSDLGVRLRASDRSAQQAAATGWFC